MKQSARLLTCAAALVVGSMTQALSAGSVGSASTTAQRTNTSATVPAPVAAVTSTDSRSQLPSFLWAPKSHPLPPVAERVSVERAARWYLQAHAARYRLSAASLATVEVRHIHDVGRGGLIVSFGQRVSGLEVLGSELNVLMREDYSLVAISGNLSPDAQNIVLEGRLAFKVPASKAISVALDSRTGTHTDASLVAPTGRVEHGYSFYKVTNETSLQRKGVELAEPIRGRQVLWPTANGLVPAWYLELSLSPIDSVSARLTAHVVSAQTGQTLFSQDLTSDATYNVWAGPGSPYTPYSGPIDDWLPYPYSSANNTNPAFISPNSISLNGFNSAPGGSSDPWLSDDATGTSGNNVWAYADQYSPDGFSDGDTAGAMSAPGEFNWLYDVALSPVADAEQIQSAIQQLFYTTNWLHDWYYDSGFNESAGNAQLSNYGRGGLENDVLKAEGQDAYYSGSKNNANMSTPADGASPRMQMYVWDGEQNRFLTIYPDNKNLTTGTAAFGPNNFDVTGSIIVANDGSGTTSDACSALVNAVAGKIVMVDRGTCTFKVKAQNAQNAGAIGVIVANNQTGSPPNMSDPDPTVPVSVPTLSITLDDGNAIKASLATTSVSARMFRETGVTRDGTIDNSVVGHEWGHYLHNRNIGSCSTTQCRSQGEGWADFVALHMMYEEGDDPTGSYAVAQYASAYMGDSGYFGIRRYPYSWDRTRNALTFKHIQRGEPLPSGVPAQIGSTDNAEVHNAGEVWATMMWEVYTALRMTAVDEEGRYGYDELRRRMSDYVVAGMIMAPINPTYTQQRDGVLAAISAYDDLDARIAAEAFASRGAGTCAVSPPAESTDLVGVVESYELSANLSLVSVAVEEAADTCDGDGILDGGESGRVIVTVMNTGMETLTDTTVSISTATAGAQLVTSSDSIGSVEPFEVGSVSFEIRLDDSFTDISALDISVDAANSSSCVGSATSTGSFRVNADDIADASSTETAESERASWTEESTIGAGPVWSREADDALNHHFHGLDSASLTDVSYVSPVLDVATGSELTLTFQHAFDFETSTDSYGVTTYWDGAVIEVKEVGAEAWEDISVYGDPGYGGVIGNQAGNPLMDRQAYVGKNVSWPAYDSTTINLGSAFAGKSIQVRFRIGTDAAAGATGWLIDNIAASGLSNLPFDAVVADATSLNTFYADADGDGVGNADSGTVQACSVPAGYSASSDDCNDAASDTFPGAPELCDEVDTDCDGVSDNGFDTDNDGFTVCGGDCDDSNANANPDADEIRDGVDNDCDGVVDEAPGCGGGGGGARSPYGALVPFSAILLFLSRRRFLG